MTTDALVSVSCPDRVGLVAAISGRLFDLGGNLGDTSFAVLGGTAKFTSVVTLPDEVSLPAVEDELRSLPQLNDAEISVSPFTVTRAPDAGARISHRICVSGGDRPGLIARLSEVFVEFGANIVRLDAERIPGPGAGQYVVLIALSIPDKAVPACLATIANTAGSLGLTCHWEEA